MESLYYYMKSKAADIIAVPTRNSDDESSGPLLLENGPEEPQRDGGLIVVDDSDDRSPKDRDEASGHAEWSPQRMIAGKKFADELEGDLVLMTRRGDEYFGRMGVVVRKGVIVDDGRTIYEIHLLERRAKDPRVVFMVEESLHFAADVSERRI